MKKVLAAIYVFTIFPAIVAGVLFGILAGAEILFQYL